MRIGFIALALLNTGCFQPVESLFPVVVSCHGSCPSGECDEGCAEAPDAGCDTPEACLRTYGCSKSPSQHCSAYVDAEPTCAQNGEYCLTSIATAGVSKKTAVRCADSGRTVTECIQVGDPCSDAGSYPAERTAICGKRYCIR